MGTSHSNDALMLIGGLELLRHAIRSVQPKEETYIENEELSDEEIKDFCVF